MHLNRGFSLIELVVVIGIATLLLAIGYPRLAPLVAKYRLDSAAWNLATELQKARLRAIAENQCFRVTFDGSTRTYQLSKRATPCSSSGYSNDGSAKTLDETGMIAVSASLNPTFTPRGVIDGTTGSVVSLTVPPSGSRTVFVQVSGRVYVQ